MSAFIAEVNLRPDPDPELQVIAHYVHHFSIERELAFDTARYALLDSLGCALLALNYPACRKLLGPIVPNTIVPGGARVLGTGYVLDPIQAAFNNGTLIRWLDFNDTWLAAEWGHPSDNLGAILSVADYECRHGRTKTVKDLLTAMIKAYEIQGILALTNSFNRLGFDHVVLVKIASAALAMQLLGGDEMQIMHVLSQAFIDGQSLRTYRHAPNTGTRKSWAAGDASSRGVRLAWLTQLGEMGYPSAISAKTWGFNAVLMDKSLDIERELGSYVMENILFKISFPAEFHAQTAVECAIQLYPQVKDRWQDIEKIRLTTQESAARIISKVGPLYNPADRDHCLQYMVAIGLLFGELQAKHYEADVAADPRIDFLREKMSVEENPRFSREYLAAGQRSIANTVQVFFNDGTQTEALTIEYPIGHVRRRKAGIPLLLKKFADNAATQWEDHRIQAMLTLFHEKSQLDQMRVSDFMNLWVS